jgi:hypothetical protein
MSKYLKLLALGMMMSVLTHPATAQPNAKQQLQKANEGSRQRDHVFDGRRATPNAVRANVVAKPSMVGRPASEFRPRIRVASPKAPPAPPRNLNPTGDKYVQKSIDSYKKPGTR